MDFNAGHARGAGGDAAPLLAPWPCGGPASATLCVSCRVRGSCLGAIAAEAGTTLLQAVLAGPRKLQAGEVLCGEHEPLRCVYIVRSGLLASSAGGRIIGFHLPGELVALDALARGRQGATFIALEPAELCGVRHADGPGDAAARAFFGRLWDMTSRELLRERGERLLLARSAAGERVPALLALLCARLRARGYASRDCHFQITAADIASYLGTPADAVARVLALLERRGLVEHGRQGLRVLDAQALRGQAQA